MTELEEKSDAPEATTSDGSEPRARSVRRAVSVCGWCTIGGGAGYLLRGPVIAAVVLAIAALLVCVIAILQSVLFSGSDPRSPFVRFMLLTCLLMGRQPGEYLPPGSDER